MKKDFAFVPLNTDLHSIKFSRVLYDIVKKEWALQTFGFHYIKLSDSVNSLQILNVSTNDMYVITVFANEIQLCEVCFNFVMLIAVIKDWEIQKAFVRSFVQEN